MKTNTILSFARNSHTALFLALLMMFYAVSCQIFIIQKVAPEKMADNKSDASKRFIVHAGSNLYELKDLKLSLEQLTGTLEIAQEPVYYSISRSSNYTKEEKGILNEVHIFLNSKHSMWPLGETKIPVDQIAEIRIIKDGTSGVAAVFVIMGLSTLIAILTLSFNPPKPSPPSTTSCPFVYVKDGEKYAFQGEAFGGAVGANLCRDDYMPLPMLKTTGGQYQLSLNNELQERQYTDLAELMVVEHPEGTQVLVDQSGRAQLFKQQLSPISAESYNGNNLQPLLENKDQLAYSFNDEDFARNGVELKFDKPEGAQKANLLLNAKNSIWVDQVLDAYFSKFGNKFDTWMEKQSKRPTEDRLQSIRKGDLPLSIYLKKQGEWQLLDHLFSVGPLAARDLVVPIDLTGLSGHKIELKIETGFMFWDLDYVAMDFTPASAVSTTFIQPKLAMDQNQHNWATTLQSADQNFLPQKNTGEFTEIIYPAPPAKPGMKQTVFLHSRGYYELIRSYEGEPKVKELKKLRTPGAFSEFSRAEFFTFQATTTQAPAF
ncbi:hypothetical protein [Haliscomenobacter sp.]|uniref:hypothetical protein n=1 Tax=Haliscomenobacter sp. TaxID=2717303 RepID=UPI003BA9CE81